MSTAIVWQQLELSYSLISATIPCLKSFISSFDTNFGMGDGSSEGQYNYSSGNNGSQTNSRSQIESQYQPKSSTPKDRPIPESIKMHSLMPKQSATFWRESTPESPKQKLRVGRLRPERLKSSTTVTTGIKSGNDRPDSQGSDGRSSQAGSQELIIRRDMHFDVRSDVRSDYTYPSDGISPMRN